MRLSTNYLCFKVIHPSQQKSETEVQLPGVVKDWLPKFDFDDTSVPPMGMQEEDSEDT